jgi:hypothetical protein
MLKDILSISGKPGLYKLVSQAKNMIIVESLVDGKRIPAYSKDKVVSLGDIAIYTEKEEVPLARVLESIKAKEQGGVCPVDQKADNNAIRKYMEQILPDYDRDRVYPSDMKKLFAWYNVMISCGIDSFQEPETAEAVEENK